MTPRSLLSGYPIVLTAGRALMARYRYGLGSGYASMFPRNLFPQFMAKYIFQLASDENGRMKMAQLGLCKVEAALLAAGFSRKEVIIANPEKLDRVVGAKTRVVGIGTLDPMGLAFGAKVTEFTLRQFHLPCQPSIMSAEFQRVLNTPIIRQLQQQGQLQVIVGGPGVWQIADNGLQEALSIDCIIDGEAEGVVGDLFKSALRGERVPQRVEGKPQDVVHIPAFVTASRCGVVEITRGCGRNCRFCAPGLQKFRSFPLKQILAEIGVNRQSGIEEVSLQSDDFLRYGSSILRPARKPLLLMLQAVKEVAGKKFGVSFVSAASILQDEQLLADVAELMELGGSRYSTIEMGIETGSPRLLAKHMPGKAKPFPLKEWSDIIEAAAQALHDHNWIGCFSLIIGLPEETSEDILRTMELVDRIKHLNCVITPVVFVPAGQLRKRRFQTYERMTPEQWALFQQCVDQTLSQAVLWLGRTTDPLVQRFMQYAVNPIFQFSAKLFRKRWQKRIRQLGWSLPTLSNLAHQESGTM